MKLRLDRLELTCRRSVEVIEFTDFNYFYGEMGAGKSTIARLIDFCLGAKHLVMTPALQNEFVSCALSVLVGDVALRLERERGSGQLVASWSDQHVIIPARNANGPVIPGTKVEVLSDLLFYLNGIEPPRVRRSQTKEDSELERLSFRDLWWYCYLDQDSMDSSFFNLDREAETFRRLKSRNVLRAILGVHQERVAELEQRLEEIRRERLKYTEGAKVLEETLRDADFSTELEIAERVNASKDKLRQVERQIKDIRRSKKSLGGHTVDKLRTQARQVVSELEAIDIAVGQLIDSSANDKRHLNEMLALSTKVRRLESARAVLNGVEFETCPRCTRALPPRESDSCPVCGQGDAQQDTDNAKEGEETQADLESRAAELRVLPRRMRARCARNSQAA